MIKGTLRGGRLPQVVNSQSNLFIRKWYWTTANFAQQFIWRRSLQRWTIFIWRFLQQMVFIWLMTKTVFFFFCNRTKTVFWPKIASWGGDGWVLRLAHFVVKMKVEIIYSLAALLLHLSIAHCSVLSILLLCPCWSESFALVLGQGAFQRSIHF